MPFPPRSLWSRLFGRPTAKEIRDRQLADEAALAAITGAKALNAAATKAQFDAAFSEPKFQLDTLVVRRELPAGAFMVVGCQLTEEGFSYRLEGPDFRLDSELETALERVRDRAALAGPFWRLRCEAVEDREREGNERDTRKYFGLLEDVRELTQFLRGANSFPAGADALKSLEEAVFPAATDAPMKDAGEPREEVSPSSDVPF